MHLREDLQRLGQLATRALLPAKVRVPSGPPDPPSPGLEAFLRQEGPRLDVGLGAALIAAEDQPELDPERVVEELEGWAMRARQGLGRLQGPAERLEAFTRFFFDDLGLEASPSRAGRYDEGRLADLLLPHVMRRRRGHCVGLSTLYLALGYRLGLPLYGVSAPGHFFVRWEGEGLRQNVELTSRGATHDDAYYVERFNLQPAQVDRGIYLQSLRRREVLIEVLNNRANFYWDRGDEERVLRDLDRVVRLSHNYAQAYVGRGFVSMRRGSLRQAEADLRAALEIDPENGRAWLLLGQVLLRRGDEQAEDALARATELDGRSALAATYLGLYYQQRGEAERAQRWHEQALQLDPCCHLAWVHLGALRGSLGERDKAERAYREAVQLRPESLRAREGLVLTSRGAGALHFRARWEARSICAEYERRLQRAPQSDALSGAYLRFLGEAGLDAARGEALAQELVERNPTPANAELAARALGLLGREQAALRIIERGLAEADEREGERLQTLGLRIRARSGPL